MSDYSDVALLKVISEGETDRVEFKESLSGSAPEKIREAICAFANDMPGHGAPGSHAAAANDARRDFKQLANRIAQIVMPAAMAAG